MKKHIKLRGRERLQRSPRAMSITSLTRTLTSTKDNVFTTNLLNLSPSFAEVGDIEDVLLNTLESSAVRDGGISQDVFNALDQVVASGSADNRFYSPPAVTASPATKRGSVSYRVPNVRGFNALGFQQPSRVLVCLRRKKRKEVLFAKGVAGQRGRKRRPRFTNYSYIWC